LKECEKRRIGYSTAIKNIKNGYEQSLEILRKLKSELHLTFGKSKIFTHDNREMTSSKTTQSMA
jgi:hypothetical protein